jgi:cold shock CspA family protein
MVKWFNNKTGYGFVTVSEGSPDHCGKDIFVHYKSIRTDNSDDNFKYLVQGEYVEFLVDKPEDDKHEYHAVDVTGIRLGPIMCETRRAAMTQAQERGKDDDREPFVRVVKGSFRRPQAKRPVK